MILLQIEIDNQWLDANLGDDTSISMEETSQLWNTDGGRSSIPFTLSVWANQHIIGNVSDMRGSSIFKRLYGRRWRMIVDGIPFRYGIIHMDSSVPVTDEVEIELVGNGKEWSDLISDLDCRKVPLMGDVLLGTGIDSNLSVLLKGKFRWQLNESGPSGFTDWFEIYEDVAHISNKSRVLGDVCIPSVMYPEYDGESCVNVNEPYDAEHPFCNFRICWNAKDKDGNKLRKMDVYEATRINSSPCFYVLYFIDCLFKHLSITCSRNDLKLYDEMKRLAFLNTGCFYEVKKGELVENLSPIDVGFSVEVDSSLKVLWQTGKTLDGHDFNSYCEFKDLTVQFTNTSKVDKYAAYATPENFPNKSVSEVISTLTDLFGIRFIYDSYLQNINIVFVKDILSQNSSVEIPCKIIDVYPIYEQVNGFRLRYSDDVEEEDVDVKDYGRDTLFNMPHLKSVVTTKTYDDISQNVSAFDKNFYVDPQTGNGYVIKVDKDAENASKLYPSLMEAAQFCRVEYGDCSNDDFVNEVAIDATPVVMNDVSDFVSGSYAVSAFYADVDMNRKDVETKVLNNFSYCMTPGGVSGDGLLKDPFPISFVYKFNPFYDISQNTESPLDTYDCGITLGFMRGGGNVSGSEVINFDYDGEGNAQWTTVVPSYTFHSDSIDQYGNQFDYNGDAAGIGGDAKRISLKLKAEKKNPMSREDIADEMQSNYYGNVDLLNRPLVSGADMIAAGWNVDEDDIATVHSVGYTYGGQYITMTPIKSDGSVLTKDELDAYFDSIKTASVILSADTLGLVIDIDGSEEKDARLHELQEMYYFYEEYISATGTNAAKRGIFDRFYTDYAYWVTHRKLAHIEAEVEISELINIDMNKKYRIGEYEGFLKSVKYDITNSGIGIVTFELYYL